MRFQGFPSFFCLLCVFIITGCVTTPTPAERYDLAARQARSSGMSKVVIRANGFNLVAYQRIASPGKPLNVYIEGDGLAWASRRRLSSNPTPTDPLALRLAIQDPAENVVYLARPCQYIDVRERARCTQDHWSKKRFSEDVIKASDQAIDYVLSRSKGSAVHLIGYSGGGAVAVLVAARRGDVLSLRTVAGNLDIAAFTAHHKVTPLIGSLNPAAYAHRVANIPQRHFVGSADTIIPKLIVQSFMNHLPTQRCANLTTRPDATHSDGWTKNWPNFLVMSVSCVAR